MIQKLTLLVAIALFLAPFVGLAVGLLEAVRIGGGATLLALNGIAAFTEKAA